MLEDELGFLKALVHRLEPNINLDEVKVSAVFDCLGILHYSDYRSKRSTILASSNYHEDIKNPIKEVADLKLSELRANELCLTCFEDSTDISELINDEELREGLFIVCKLENISKGQDYDKILRENNDLHKIYQLAMEYFSFMDETDQYLTDLWMNIPNKYLGLIEDYFTKSPIKIDLIHKLTLGSEQIRNILREHCKKTFNSEFTNEELVLISLMPHYEVENRFYTEMSSKLGDLGVMFRDNEDIKEQYSEEKEMHELTIALLASFAHNASFIDEITKVPTWVIEALKLSKPEVLLSKPYLLEDEVLVDIALKLYQGDKRKGNLYGDFDTAMSAAKLLK